MRPTAAPWFLLTSSKHSSASGAASVRKRALTRRSSALRRAREKSASICSSKLKYLIIDEFLYSGCVPVPEASSKQRTVRPRRAASFERGIRGEEIAADGSSTDRGFRPRRRITDTLGILRDPAGPGRANPAPWHTLVPGGGCELSAYPRCS